MNMVEQLKKERKSKTKNSLYRHIQILMAYHSNKIEGSTCTLDATKLLFDTASYDNKTPTNDIIEVFNHFRAFDMVLDTYKQQLTEDYIKGLHGLLKFNTMDIKKGYIIGDYKKIPNRVGTITTARPENVSSEIQNLLSAYSDIPGKTLRDVLNFHVKFEQIHPFQDGNGRVGRLIMFKECLYQELHHLLYPLKTIFRIKLILCSAKCIRKIQRLTLLSLRNKSRKCLRR